MAIQDAIDILENNIPKDVLLILLRDNSYTEGMKNIFWATNDYENLGAGYQYGDTIELDKIEDNKIIIPRVLKSKLQQQARAREMAEVFTPSWICNAQNNLIDNAWFGREGVFNTENDDNTWTVNPEKISFPEGKPWIDYVCDERLEITCGEAPYITSRYDTTTGDEIPVKNRIGLLDRKLRVVGENTASSKDWLSAAQDALKSTYGYEWQGDSLLLAREAVLYTYIDHYREKFGKNPTLISLKAAANIISWNLWQMDGMKGVIPDSCYETEESSLFGDTTKVPCHGCQLGDIKYHNGVQCRIKDWRANKIIRYIDMIK